MQATRTCSVEGCDKKVHANGLCSPHAHRMRRYGDPLAGGPPIKVYPGKTETERFWARVDATGVCWEWTGRLDRGYGRLWTAEYTSKHAHRWAYEHLVGPIPDGMSLDHLCRNRRCVNPDHMDVCPRGINSLRGSGPAAMNKRRTHSSVCGHEFTPENTLIIDGRRRCRTCRTNRQVA